MFHERGYRHRKFRSQTQLGKPQCILDRLCWGLYWLFISCEHWMPDLNNFPLWNYINFYIWKLRNCTFSGFCSLLHQFWQNKYTSPAIIGINHFLKEKYKSGWKSDESVIFRWATYLMAHQTYLNGIFEFSFITKENFRPRMFLRFLLNDIMLPTN